MRNITIVLSLLVGACASKPAPVIERILPVQDWSTIVTMNEGQTVLFADAGFKLGFIIPVEDSRCPVDVDCVNPGWFAGRFSFEAVPNEGKQGQSFVYLMSTDTGCKKPKCGPFVFTGTPRTAGGSEKYTITIEMVQPERVSGQEILESYRITLRITN